MKKVFAIAIILLISIGCYNMPGMISSSIPSVYYVKPDRKTYENVVNCAGTVQSAHTREIYLQSEIVPAEVCAEIGDYVKAGDTLVLIDREMTEKLSIPATDLLRDISGGISSGTKGSGIDWISLASEYGLTAVLSGGDIDYSKLQNAIQGGAAADTRTADSGAFVGEIDDKIVSPVSGVITEIGLQPEAPALRGKAIFTITDLENFKVHAVVGENDIAKINVGDKAKIRGVGFGGSSYSGTVTKIYPTARKSITGTETVVDVEIELENADSRLKPGFSAKVEITGENNYDLVTVQYEAIRQDENNNEYVYIYKDGKLKKQVVITGQELANEVEILGGLTQDSIVVYNPNGLIKEGSMISIKGRAVGN